MVLSVTAVRGSDRLTVGGSDRLTEVLSVTAEGRRAH